MTEQEQYNKQTFLFPTLNIHLVVGSKQKRKNLNKKFSFSLHIWMLVCVSKVTQQSLSGVCSELKWHPIADNKSIQKNKALGAVSQPSHALQLPPL